QVLLRTIWQSLDPYMRGRMSEGPSYAAPVPIGGVMEGGTVCEVIASNNPSFAKDDIVLPHTGWQTHALSDGRGLRKIDAKLGPVSTAVGVLGMPGMTAYVGLLEIGKPKPGETVVVAAASGAVGSVVGQIAKIKGARAVGIAGGAAKCRFVTEELGFDACIDHRAPDPRAQPAAPCPRGHRRRARQGARSLPRPARGQEFRQARRQGGIEMNVRGKAMRSIWLEPDGWSVGIIDQRGLPHAFVTERLATLDEAAEAIRA